MAKGKPAPTRELAKIPGAKAGTLRPLEPQLACPADQPPEGDQWFHEIKLDGYRLTALVENGKARLLTRKGNDWTKRFPRLARVFSELSVSSALVDGEVVGLEPNGVSNFQVLQNTLSEGRADQLVYFAFDLLFLDGVDLTSVVLERRKEVLSQLISEAKGLRFCDHVVGNGAEFLRQARMLGLEGIVSKRRDRPYSPGRAKSWLKIKCSTQDDFVVVGFTMSTDGRNVGALVLARPNPRGELIHVGKVGSGFTDRSLAELLARLRPIQQPVSPLAGKPRTPKEFADVRWVKPALVASVRFANWSQDGVIRHAAFLGLREDVELSDLNTGGAALISEPAPANKVLTAPIRLTHPDRLFYPEQGITKAGLVAYYIEVADWMLPHIVNRPLSLVRCPDGREGKSFFQKHTLPGGDKAIRELVVTEASDKVTYLYVDDLAGLLALAQHSALEIHVWGARIDDIEKPDRLVFDLDPGEGVPWSWVAEGAREVRSRLKDLGLVSFLKTTGGKGLHVVAPIRRRQSWSAVFEFCRAFAAAMHADAPQRYILTATRAARQGRIYLDYHRNKRGATAVAAYSTRALSGAPVSVPVAWDELDSVRANYFSVKNLPTRLASLHDDPWRELPSVNQSITAEMQRRVSSGK